MGIEWNHGDFSVGIDIFNVKEKPSSEIVSWGNDLDFYVNFWKGHYDSNILDSITKNEPRIYKFSSFEIDSQASERQEVALTVGVDKPALVSVYNSNYLHTLYESVGRILYLDYLQLDYEKKFLIRGKYPSMILSDSNLLELGIDPEKDVIKNYDFSTLIVHSSFNTRSDRLIHLENYGIISKLLRSKLRLNGSPIDDIYVSRKNAINDERFINDEEKIEEYYQNLGYKIVYNEELTFDQQREVYKNAKSIVGISGTGLINILFAPDECKLTELLTSDFRNDQVFQYVCSFLGNEYELIDAIDANHSAESVINNITCISREN